MAKNTDFKLPFNDLISYVPQKLRKPMISSLIDNLFNRFLTHDESIPLFGYAGKKPALVDDKMPKIPQMNADRDINSIIPVFNFDVGNVKHTFTFTDIINRAKTIGIDGENLDWVYSQGNNFVPPINLDKFTNFYNYYWIAQAVDKPEALPWNPDLLPEYYTIARHVPESINKENVVVASTEPVVLSGSGLGTVKFELVFLSDELFSINIIGNIGNVKPINTNFSLNADDETEITFFGKKPSGEVINLLSFVITRDKILNANNEVIDIGKFENGDKFLIDSPFLSRTNTIKFTGSLGLKGKISKLFSYNDYQTIDGVKISAGMRVLVKDNSENENGIYIVQPQSWVRSEDFTGSNAKAGSNIFVKTGSQLNTFWQAKKVFNGFDFIKIAGVSKSNTNDWQDGNHWVKNTDLANLKIDRSKVIQAKRPIIEYHGDIELNRYVKNNKPSEAGTTYQQQKTQFNQLPQFDLFRYDGTHSGHTSAIFYYEEDLTAQLDVKLQKRVLKSKNLSKDFVFNHGARDDNGLLFFKRDGKLSSVFHPGYKNVILNTPQFVGGGNGNIEISALPNSAQQIWKLKAISPTVFSVSGTKNKKLPSPINEIIVGENYKNDEFTAKIIPGNIPFQINDEFNFQIGNLETAYFVFKDLDDNISTLYGGPQADVNGKGAWQTPRMLVNNPYNETSAQLEEGVLYSHFRSILSNQFSQKSDLAFGGSIKLWSEQQTLLVSLLMQRDLTPISMIDLAQQQYENALNQIRDIYQQTIVQYIANHGIVSESDLDTLLDQILKVRKQDNDVRTVLFDSTAAVVGFPITLPMLGISKLVEPQFKFDECLGQDLILCHDGHHIGMEIDDSDYRQSLFGPMTEMKISRSDGEYTPAIGSFTINPPAKPYRGELWVMPQSNGEHQTLVFNVISDGKVKPVTRKVGTYWFNRSENVLYSWDGNTWVIESNMLNAWTQINFANIQNHLLLRVERRLFNGINKNARKFDFSLIEKNKKFRQLLANELFTFSSVNNYDPMAPDFKADDAFTWNYSSANIDNFPPLHDSKVPARWYDILMSHHQTISGIIPTARPNLEPFKLLGYYTLDEWQSAGALAKVPFATEYISTTPDRLWSTQLWLDIKSYYKDTSLKLSVDILTDDLLPPYVNEAASSNRSENALTNIGPTNKINPLIKTNASYEFGDNGPVELVWRKSIDFGYALAKSLFRYDPLAFLGFCWGFNWVEIDNILYDGFNMDMPGHKRFKLHGDVIPPNLHTSILVTPLSGAVGSFNIEFTAYDNDRKQNFTIISEKGNLGYIQEGKKTIFENHEFLIEDNGHPFRIGDKFTISTKSGIDVKFIPEKNYKFQGFGQIFTHALRAISIDTNNGYAINAFRNWDVNMGYRASGLVSTNDLKVFAGNSQLTDSAYSLILKKNEVAHDKWLQSLRIQVTKFGNAEENIDGLYFPIGRGDDWEFRIEGYNPRYLDISFYEMDSTQAVMTFNALNKSHTDFEWQQPTKILATKKTKLPLTITGVQNVVNFLYGYSKYIENEGWEFSSTESSNIDFETGRNRNWQLEIEKFVDACFGGIKLKQGHVINPFMDKVWLHQETGLLSEFYETSLMDITGHPGVYDALGVKMKASDLNILRSNVRSEISANAPIFSIHAQIDEYEHLFMFNNLSKSGESLYHPFSGSRVITYNFNAKMQANKTLRPEYAGHFISGNKVVQNLQASTDSVAQLYDANTMYQNEDASRNALALFGFNKKEYLTNLDITDKTHFNFWRGLIHAKGTNMSVSAYLNNDRFKDAKLDEFWAYKIAEYGDSRQKTYPELKLSINDSLQQFTKFQFDANYGAWNKETNPHGELPGFTIISSADESKWINLEDLNHDASFTAEVVGVFEKDVKLDEVISLPFIADSLIGLDDSTFEIVNATTIIAKKDGIIKITGYGPASPKYNPIKLFNYVDRELIEEIPVWHPACGIHTPRAMENINIISNFNPAKFNYSVLTESNSSYDPLRPWGDKELGRVWFNTSNLFYIPYFDQTLFTDIDERLSRWGALAEHASIDVYEWIKSDVSPYEYNAKAKTEAGDADIDESIRAAGEVAGEQTYVRERNWNIFPIAWSHTPVLPSLDGSGHPSFFTSFKSILFIEPGINDGHLLYLDSHSFKEYGIFAGMHIGAWDWDKDYPKPLSEMVITNSFTKKIATIDEDGNAGNPFTTITTTINQIADNSNFVLSFPISECGGVILGYAFQDGDEIDPAATKPIYDCDGIVAYGYPTSSTNTPVVLSDCDGEVEAYISPYDTIQVLTPQPVMVNVEVEKHTDVIGAITIERVVPVTTLSVTSTATDPVWETPIYVRLIENITGKNEMLLLNTAIGTIAARDPIPAQPAVPEQPEQPATRGTYLVKIGRNLTGSTGLLEFPPTGISGNVYTEGVYSLEVTVDDIPHYFTLKGSDIDTFEKLIQSINLFLPSSPCSAQDDGLLFTSPSAGSQSNIYVSGGNLFALLPGYDGMIRKDGEDLKPAIPAKPAIPGQPGITPGGTHGATLTLQAGRPYVFISEVFGLKFTITPEVSGVYMPESFQDAIVKALIPTGNSTNSAGGLFLQDAVYAKTIVAMLESFGLTDGIRVLSNDPINEDSEEGEKNIGWVAWNVPTQIQLDEDGQQPNSSWKPYIGDEHQIDSRIVVIQEAIKYFSNPLTLNNGTKVNRYAFKWNDWRVLNDTVYKVTNSKATYGEVADIIYEHEKAIDENKTTVYLNGLAQLQAQYKIHGNKVIVKNVSYGAEVTIIIRKDQPTLTELSFNPDVEENYTYQHQYKIDFDYVSLPIRDFEGAITSTNYYFWVKNKSTPAFKKRMSIKSITQELKEGPEHYITFQNQLPKSETQDVRYDAITLSGLNFLVTKDDTFNLRFTRDFTLRDDPHDLDLKDTHTEWTLLREHQRARIPEQLWRKLSDSVVGQDSAGNPIPSIRRQLYDERNGTSIRFGFGDEQSLAPIGLLRQSIIYILQNTKRTIDVGGIDLPDYITFLDLDNPEAWFSTVNTSRETMASIWANANTQQINEIFFTVMNDMLACNYELTDLFKTSRLSAYSIKVVQTNVASETFE